MNNNHTIHKQIMKLCRHFNKSAFVLHVDDNNKVSWLKYGKHIKDDAVLAYINNIPVLDAYKMVLANPRTRALEDNMFYCKR